MSRLLPVHYEKQDTEYSCGPACMQMVFAYYHKRVSERELIKELRTNEAVGTNAHWMVRIARKWGFFCYVNNTSSLEELRYFLSLKKPIVVYFVEPSANDDHYAVVVGCTEKDIILQDPYNGKKFRMGVGVFEKRWKKEKQYQKAVRCWMLVLSPETFSPGRQYAPLPKFLRGLV